MGKYVRFLFYSLSVHPGAPNCVAIQVAPNHFFNTTTHRSCMFVNHPVQRDLELV